MPHQSIPFQKNAVDLVRLSAWLNQQDGKATLGFAKASGPAAGTALKLTARRARVTDGLARLQGLASVFNRIRSRRTGHNLKILSTITDAARAHPLLADQPDAQAAIEHLNHLLDMGRAYQGRSLRVKDIARDVQTLNLALQQAELRTARGAENRANLALQQLGSATLDEVPAAGLLAPSQDSAGGPLDERGTALGAAEQTIRDTAAHWNRLLDLAADGFGGPIRSPAQRTAEGFVTALASVASTTKLGSGYVPPSGMSANHLLLDKGRAALDALIHAPDHARAGLADTTQAMLAIAREVDAGQRTLADFTRFQEACQAHATRFEAQLENLIRLAATLMMPSELGRPGGPQESAVLRRYGESLMVLASSMMDPQQPMARAYQMARIGITRPSLVLSALVPAVRASTGAPDTPADPPQTRTLAVPRSTLLRAQSAPQRRLAAAEAFQRTARDPAPTDAPPGDATPFADVNHLLDDLLSVLLQADENALPHNPTT